MAKYFFVINETEIRKFEVEADTYEKAKWLAEEKYFTGDYSGLPDEVILNEMSVEEANYDDDDYLCF